MWMTACRRDTFGSFSTRLFSAARPRVIVPSGSTELTLPSGLDTTSFTAPLLAGPPNGPTSRTWRHGYHRAPVNRQGPGRQPREAAPDARPPPLAGSAACQAPPDPLREPPP